MQVSKGQATLAALGILLVLLFVGAVAVATIMWAKGTQITHELDISVQINDLGREMNGILESRTSDLTNMEIAGGFFAAGHQNFQDRESSLNRTLYAVEKFFIISDKDGNVIKKTGRSPGESGDLVTQIAIPGAGKSPAGTRGAVAVGG